MFTRLHLIDYTEFEYVSGFLVDLIGFHYYIMLKHILLNGINYNIRLIKLKLQNNYQSEIIRPWKINIVVEHYS